MLVPPRPLLPAPLLAPQLALLLALPVARPSWHLSLAPPWLLLHLPPFRVRQALPQIHAGASGPIV